MIKIKNFIKQNILPILYVLGGIIDLTTDLLVQLLNELQAPIWTSTVLRIVIISFGVIKTSIKLNGKLKK
jgi:uncharacterized membrane protein YesL